MRKLKWSLRRDQLAKLVRDGTVCGVGGTGVYIGFGKWLENKGRGIVQDGERVRLAICPGVRNIVDLYERLRV